jgi:AhpD family alkylhydroperoxidase
MYNKTNLGKLKKMDSLAPDVMKAFWAFDKAAVAEGAIPVKYKELIAIGVALTTQCPYCIDIHAGNARKAGATEAELAEAAMVAGALRADAAVTHATHALAASGGEGVAATQNALGRMTGSNLEGVLPKASDLVKPTSR